MKNSKKLRALTGLQPTGNLHIGNYFGSMKPLLDMTKDHDVVLMVADYHALTSVKDRDILRKNILNIVRDYLAVGFDPKQIILFRQSDNPDHVELGWIFNCLVTIPFLMQAHAYKDKIAKNLEPNAGLFTYPMLMASDIVLYNTDIVPVGEDQRQHIEYTREVVNKFNGNYGELFKTPKEMIMKTVGVVPGTDGQKMSKSYNNTIPLFSERDEIQKAVMSIVTDSSGDKPENVYAIHKLFMTGREQELERLYEENHGRYKILKEALVEEIDSFITPLRAKRKDISDALIHEVLEDGVEKAKEVSNETMQKVRKMIGISI